MRRVTRRKKLPWTVTEGDVRDVLPTLAPESFDSVVTDPPYELGFMGKKWDASGVAYDPKVWKACYDALKPGGYLVAFGGTRTYHRMVCAIEDAGFEIRDSLHWVYGSGFPKSLNVSKAIDKAAGAQRKVIGVKASNRPNVVGREPGGSMGGGTYTQRLETVPATPDAACWDGWGTALKPAHEPIVMARKPFKGSVTANVLEYGTGGINIDGCRIASDDAKSGRTRHGGGIVGNGSSYELPDSHGEMPAGRWPPNVILSDESAEEMDRQSGVTTSGKNRTERGKGGIWSEGNGVPCGPQHGDSGGASRFFPIFKYQAKAPKSERPVVEGLPGHPTVKPLALARWLTRLVTPPGGKVLIPFAGSGTEIEAAYLEGFIPYGIENDPNSVLLIRKRMSKHVPR